MLEMLSWERENGSSFQLPTTRAKVRSPESPEHFNVQPPTRSLRLAPVTKPLVPAVPENQDLFALGASRDVRDEDMLQSLAGICPSTRAIPSAFLDGIVRHL